jgi:hypothetical protein
MKPHIIKSSTCERHGFQGITTWRFCIKCRIAELKNELEKANETIGLLEGELDVVQKERDSARREICVEKSRATNDFGGGGLELVTPAMIALGFGWDYLYESREE